MITSRDSATTALSCNQITKSFYTRNGTIQALDEISLEIEAAEFVCIVGPSGCGKSTLLKIIAGLIEPTGGELSFSSTGPQAALPRNAMVFQEHGLFPWMSLLDNVAFGLETHGIPRQPRRQQALDFLGQLGLAAFAGNYPHQLSVGMRQRAALARAFLADPAVLLMDEPFSALDAQSKLVLQQELLRIWRDHRKTVVFITHDIEEAVLLGDRVVVMSGHPGRILKDIRIPVERPRDLRDREQTTIREITWHIWKTIEDEVRRNLQFPV